MQAILLITMFTLMLSVINGIITGSGSSTAELTAERIAQTKAYFKAIDAVVNQELTPNHWKANTVGTTNVAQFVRLVPSLKQLSPSRFTDKALDPWSNPIVGKIITENRIIYADAATGARVMAPITGFLLVSMGPDRQLQTKLNVTTLSGLLGAVPPAGSDDIAYTFTDEMAQRDQLKRLQGHVGRIAAAALQDYQLRLSTYRAARIASYQAQLAAGGSIADLDDMMEDGANAPTFLPLSSAATRTALGVDEEFQRVEEGTSITSRASSQRGRLRVLSSAVGKTLTLKVYNGSPATPWFNPAAGGLLYQLSVKGS